MATMTTLDEETLLDAIEEHLDRLVPTMTLGECQVFERLETNLDRLCFLVFVDEGANESVTAKVQAGQVDQLTTEERQFCSFCRQIFQGGSPQEFLQRRPTLEMGWMRPFIKPG